MADGVRHSHTIRVQQALHGYSNGHRLLASSATLKGRDAKTMLVLSDVSGPNARIGERGYLTGYPLNESGFYALGRTWAATEMPRPGCVWTHTLLIDFADLAVLDSLRALILTFRRPTCLDVDRSAYEVPLTVTVDAAASYKSADEAINFLRRALWSLYGSPQGKVFMTEPAFNPEPWVLAIWGQQWPRLRRSFRFCTQSFADRSSVTAPFDLQIVPIQDRAALGRPPATGEANQVPDPQPEWLGHALEDLVTGRSEDFRNFLRSTGGDITGGREAFVPLCSLYGLLSRAPSDPSAIEDAIVLLDDALGQSEARILRAFIVAEAARQVQSLGERAFAFLIRHLDLLESTGPHQDDRIGRALWSRAPAEFGRLLDGQEPVRTVAERTLASLPLKDLVEGLRRNRVLLAPLLARRPDIVTHPDFWGLEDAANPHVFEVAGADENLMRGALDAMIRAGTDRLATAAVDHFGPGRVLVAVIGWLEASDVEEPTKPDAAWLSAGLREPGAVAGILSSRVVRRRSTLVTIARATKPDTIPNDFGEDPWLIAMRSASGEASDPGRLYLAAYLFSRALGSQSRNQADLLAVSLDDVYSAALRSRLPEEAWHLLEPRLPQSYFWFSWDHCKRLRVAVADTFVGRGLPPLTFGNVTSDDGLFTQLAEIAARKPQGYSYLKLVRDALRNAPGNAKRLGVLESLV